jgi:hypothetical protein
MGIMRVSKFIVSCDVTSLSIARGRIMLVKEVGGLNEGITQRRRKQSDGYFALYVSFAHISPL